MFFTKILKAIPFLFQILLVVAAVVAFTYFDPFGIMLPTKMKLKDTPVDVQSIKSIGQLITAEYYGEVVRSYAHQAVEEGEEELNTMEKTVQNINDQFVLVTSEIANDLKTKEIKKRDVFDRYKALMGALRNDPYYGQYMYFLFINQVKKKNYNRNDLDNDLSGNREELVVNRIVEGRTTIPDNDNYLKPLFDTFKDDMQKDQRKKFKKSNLVMLGRGWVKAGFDFGEFNENNFHYDAGNRNIYLIGLKPQILSATINPWFIPEKGVEGFEFLVVQRKVRRDYNVVKQVKQMCLDELKRKAFEHDILTLATDNAKASLKEFFSLLLGNEVNHITFYENELDFTRDEITKNDSISGEELLLIEHLLEKKSYVGIPAADTSAIREQRTVFMDSLRKVPVYLLGQKVANGWSPEWAMAYEVAKNGVFDQSADKATIDQYSKRYCADTAFHWASNCAQNGLSFIKNNVAVFIWRDSSQWTHSNAAVIRARLSPQDSLWIQPKNKPRRLVGLRIGLDDQKEPLDSLVLSKHPCNCQ